MLADPLEACTPQPPGYYAEKVVLFTRGNCTFGEKATNVILGGAKGGEGHQHAWMFLSKDHR